MLCARCGGFYNQQCVQWPNCYPVPPDDNPMLQQLKRSNELAHKNGIVLMGILAALLVLMFK